MLSITAFLTGDKLELKADHVDINPHYAERCARCLLLVVVVSRLSSRLCAACQLTSLFIFLLLCVYSMEIETFTMHLDFEHTFTEDDATGTILTSSSSSLKLCRHCNPLSVHPFSSTGGGRLQLHALDPSKQHALPVYNNSGMAGFEAGLEEVRLCSRI